MTASRWFILGFAVALLAAVGCGSSDNGGPPPPPAFVCSDGGAPGANAVTLVCGGTAGTDAEFVSVVLGGPASGTETLRGLTFDLTYDPSKVAFEEGSESADPLFADALLAVRLDNGVQGRVILGIDQPSNLSPIAVSSGPHVVLTLKFKRASGASFGPTPVSFQNAEVTGVTPPATISFASSPLALAYQ